MVEMFDLLSTGSDRSKIYWIMLMKFVYTKENIEACF